MRAIQNSQELRSALHRLKKKNQTLGFVPTMGSLHEGHLSLVRQAKKENKAVVVSIFVNPLQFGPKEDFWRYPRNLLRDADLLRKERIQFLFTPHLKEFYRADFETSVSVRRLSQPLCGLTRPTHFAGVATVVLKLLNLVQPDVIYLGQKDYQQFRIIEQMTRDLDFPTKVKMAPIVREKDGVAMSSRNVLLSAPERREAPVLYRAVQEGARLLRSGVRDATRIKKAMKEVLKYAPHAKADYVEIVNAQTLEPMVKLNPGQKALVALAVFFGKTRLIDNELVTG